MPLRILVVDDEPLIAMLVQDWLVDLGCEVLGPAHTVDDAMALIDGSSIDGAFLDVSLGSGNSYGIAEALQSRSVPIAFATGHGAASIDPRFSTAITIAKPFDFASMERVVASFAH